MQRPGEWIARSVGDRNDILGGRKRAPRVGEDLLAGRGWPHGMADALEDREPKLLFQFADLARERRLADAARFGRAAEMSEIGNRDDIAKITQVHVWSRNLSAYDDHWRRLSK